MKQMRTKAASHVGLDPERAHADYLSVALVSVIEISVKVLEILPHGHPNSICSKH